MKPADKKTKNKLKIPDKIYNPDLGKYVNKFADFQFAGERCGFFLSHALFSSFDIDDGTVLLLKTIAQQIEFTNIKYVRDIGSGTGAIGICLKKKYPGIDMSFSDRDALALDFTEENCRQNGINDFHLLKELGIESTEKKYDLVVSNIPAKIGDKAFEDFVIRSLRSLKDCGLCAFVIITSFADSLKKSILSNGGTIVFEECNTRHSVYHFKPESYIAPACSFSLDAYRRGTTKFVYQGYSYEMNSVYNLPDFDVMGYQTRLALDMSSGLDVQGPVLIWNPVHGHLPVNIAKLFSGITEIHIGSRDLLQLRITSENLLKNGFDGNRLVIHHTSFISQIAVKAGLIFVLPDITPFTTWEEDLVSEILEIMDDNAKLIISSEAADIKKIVAAADDFNVIKKGKMKSYSCIIMERKKE